MSIQVKEVAFIYHPVSDIGRARAFYEGLLGLKIDSEFEFAPGTWWIEYDIAGTTLGVSNAMPGAEAAGGSIALEVADLDATLASVKAAGITPTLEIQDFKPCRMFTMKTADGHGIIFHKRKY
jgi:predicted enzyme related to lactoylglutathione lyase